MYIKMLGFFGLVVLTGCQSYYPSQHSYQQKLNKWIGKSAEELYDVWGFPPQTTPIDNNTFMVTYYKSEAMPIDDDYEPYADDLNYDAMSVPSFGLPPAPALFYCQTSFVLRDDTVVDFNFNGDDCK